MLTVTAAPLRPIRFLCLMMAVAPTLRLPISADRPGNTPGPASISTQAQPAIRAELEAGSLRTTYKVWAST